MGCVDLTLTDLIAQFYLSGDTLQSRIVHPLDGSRGAIVEEYEYDEKKHEGSPLWSGTGDQCLTTGEAAPKGGSHSVARFQLRHEDQAEEREYEDGRTHNRIQVIRQPIGNCRIESRWVIHTQ